MVTPVIEHVAYDTLEACDGRPAERVPEFWARPVRTASPVRHPDESRTLRSAEMKYMMFVCTDTSPTRMRPTRPTSTCGCRK